MNLEGFRIQIERYSQMLKLRFDIKREYFTILMPAVIAIGIVIWAIITGHTFSFKNNPVLKKDDLDHILVYAVLVGIIPYSIDTFLQKKIQKRRESSFSDFLFKLSELLRGGIDPVKGVINLSKSDLGPITKNVRDASASMVLGYSFESSMNRMAESLNSKLIKRYIDIIVQAAYTGGAVADLLFRTSEDMRAVIGIERDKEANLKQYIIIFYLAQGIMIMLAFILSDTLLPMIQDTGLQMLSGKSTISEINFSRGFFHMIILNGFFGGLVIGMITEGEIKHGFKHSAVLLIISYLACTAFILPTGGGGVQIEVVSGGGQTASPGVPPEKPIVFNVTDSKDKPLKGTNVDITMSPEGVISGNKTNESGLVAVRPIPPTAGERIEGEFTINATVGSAMNSTNLTVVKPDSD
ncbi:MAG: type II secretion system F family protein [Methanohalobium sp.]|uniref:type II secretion system F family protein n=1 Tax=Methanohalobium sp. TaxID=2837493 RepID=UPI003979248E